MANVDTFNLTVYLTGADSDKMVSFRGISRVAVNRYKKHYIGEYTNPGFHVEKRPPLKKKNLIGA